MLLNGFELPEDSITASNYNAALHHLNSSNPDTVFGLDIKTCDMQKLLSEVPILMKIYQTPISHFYSNLHCVCSGSGGNRSGLYCLHRGHYQNAGFPSLVCPVFYHASLPRTLNTFWQHRRSRSPFERLEFIS